MNCIVTTHPEFKALAEETKLPLYELDYKVALWQEKHNEFDRFPSKEELTKDVTYSLKATKTIVDNLDRIKSLWRQIPDKNVFWNKIQKDFAIPKEQVELFKNSEGNTIEEKLTNFLASYSYTIEINTATKGKQLGSHIVTDLNQSEFSDENGWEVTHAITNERIGVYNTEEEAWEIANNSNNIIKENTQHYSNLTVPGGTAYTENEISTPLITPSIKGHAQFATDNGIGWFRSDDKSDNKPSPYKDEPPYGDSLTPSVIKTRRILEVQSDIFQKGRDIKSPDEIINELKKSGELQIKCD